MPSPRKAAHAAALLAFATLLTLATLLTPRPAQATAAAPAASGAPAPARPGIAPAESPESDAPPAPAPSAAPSDAVQDKFRRFQKEMSRSGGQAAPSGAPGPAGSPAGEAPEPAGILSFSLKMLFGLAFVLVLAVLSIRLLKRLQGRMLARPTGDGAGGDIFEVMESCHLGAQQRVVALRIQDEVGIVGVTPQGISLLTVLKQPAGDIRRARIGSGNPAAFSENLNRILDRFKKPKRVSDLLNESRNA